MTILRFDSTRPIEKTLQQLRAAVDAWSTFLLRHSSSKCLFGGLHLKKLFAILMSVRLETEARGLQKESVVVSAQSDRVH